MRDSEVSLVSEHGQTLYVDSEAKYPAVSAVRLKSTLGAYDFLV
jgi:hypothetical protein